jgi:hypothetical protein
VKDATTKTVATIFWQQGKYFVASTRKFCDMWLTFNMSEEMSEEKSGEFS